MVPGDDLLRFRRIQVAQVGFRHFLGAMLLGVLVDHRHRRLRQDRDRGRDDVELVGAELVLGEVGLVLPGDQHVAEAALGESGGGAARTGVQHRHVLVDLGDERARLGVVVLVLLQRVGVSGEEVPAAAAGGLGVRSDHRDAGLGQVVPVVDSPGVALAHQQHDSGVVRRAVAGQAALPVVRQQVAVVVQRVDVGGDAQRRHVRFQAVDDGAALLG